MSDSQRADNLPPHAREIPIGWRIRLDERTTAWAGGSVLIGGSPWRISRLAPAAQRLVAELRAAGSSGLALSTPGQRAAARVLLDRGFAHPVCAAREAQSVPVIIPVLDRPLELAALLDSLEGSQCIVVDDGSEDPSAIVDVAQRSAATVIHHERNRGPAAARNTALRAVDAEVVALTDSDCVAGPGWPAGLVGHFDDPGVAAVAPRIVPFQDGRGVLAAYETARSSLDMGRWPQLVKPGAALGFVPSAALLLRRSAVLPNGFDERLRLGEDVDLVWRLVEAGWQVRYDPSTVVYHRVRPTMAKRLHRIHEYGTSAADLEHRHPGHLVPARLSIWNLAAGAALLAGRPLLGALPATVATALLARRLSALPEPTALAARTVGSGMLSDAAQVGRMLRCEWFPVGVAAVACTSRSRSARVLVGAMVLPLLAEWVRARPAIDPVRYVGLRLLDDAAYGSGVIRSVIRSKNPRPLIPAVSRPSTEALAGGVRSILKGGLRRRPARVE